MDTNDTPDHSELSADVTATGTASTRPSYEITPELRPHADAIMATDLNTVPTPHSIPEGWGTSLTMRSTGLPPEMRREVEEKLAQLGDMTAEQRAAKDVEFTAQAIRSKRMSLRILTGVGADATPYHREQVAIAREVRELDAEFLQLSSELAHVLRHDTVVDPATGEATAVPVYAVTGERLRAYAARQDDISRRRRLLVNDDGSMGYESEKRLRQALYDSSVARAKLQQQLEERAEVKQMAQQINRDRRIKEQAERLASLQRNAS